jgi:predicted RNase H-like HicB family nuclease
MKGRNTEIARRLRQLQTTERLNGAAFSKRLGISPNRWSNYLSGSALPRDTAIALVETIPGLTLDWIYLGRRGGLTTMLDRRLEMAAKLMNVEEKASGHDVEKIMRYAVVVEKMKGYYSAYVPDLPGCIATADTVESVEREIRDAIRFHIDGLKVNGLPVPKPSSIADYVEA